jgi:RNA-directed DNA polymerase
MRRESHVRFCEGGGVQLSSATRRNIYVRSEAAGERVMASIVAFLEGKLRLKVNQAKSAVAPVLERSFLGHRLLPGGRFGLAPKSLDRAKDRLRRITRRNRGIALERMVREVNSFTTGWVTYFRHAACKEALRETDEWLRRKLRCVRLKQCKRAKATADFLMQHGVAARNAWRLAVSGKGWWRRSGSPPAHQAMTLQWFAKLGLVSLQAHHATLQPAGNRRVR